MTSARGQQPPALECTGLTVRHGGVSVLDQVQLTVGNGQVLALLGPSGAGKSTLLYAVAGFLRPTAGTISLAGRLVSGQRVQVPPERRSVGMLFQGYALWPHLSARDTVAYPLRRAGRSAAEARSAADALLTRLGTAGLADRRPEALSGGEQQRVALARALARDADLYLFDEPTAHLDSALRARVLDEVAERRAATGAAAVYATHDATEALAVADVVALLRGGRIVQCAPPQVAYAEPVDRWVAELTGPASVLSVVVDDVRAGSVRLAVGGIAAAVAGGAAGDSQPGRGRVVAALVRPDWATLGGPFPGRVRRVRYRGPHSDYQLETAAGEVTVRAAGPPSLAEGSPTGWSLSRVWLLAGGVSGVALSSASPGPADAPPGRS